MTENKYSWVRELAERILPIDLDMEVEQKRSILLARKKLEQTIISKHEELLVEARIDEWKEFQWAHDVSDTIKDIVYVNYIKDRVSGLKMELGELTKELKDITTTEYNNRYPRTGTSIVKGDVDLDSDTTLLEGEK